MKYWINTGFYEASTRYYQDTKSKHDVRSCGCNFTKCALLIGREKHWFQSQFQADRVFCKFCQAGDIFSSEFFTHLLDQ